MKRYLNYKNTLNMVADLVFMDILIVELIYTLNFYILVLRLKFVKISLIINQYYYIGYSIIIGIFIILFNVLIGLNIFELELKYIIDNQLHPIIGIFSTIMFISVYDKELYRKLNGKKIKYNKTSFFIFLLVVSIMSQVLSI
jgi:hypothetical protein